ncbi:unnamed protein product, partial [Schistosoma mattheei]
IILNFWTTYVSKSGQVVYHLKAIAINYLRGWFFLDLLAAIPFDVILAVNNPEIQGTIGEMSTENPDDPGFVLLSTRHQGVTVILKELMTLDGFNPVSLSLTVRDITTELSDRPPVGL